MITPQQIDQISFSQTRHGYDMEQVDKILEPLTEDYVTLYKENALLKSKMRVLVGKLEEYRKNEAAAKDAATETVTAHQGTYPVITLKLHCTGTLKDGTKVTELVSMDYYVDNYTGYY